MGAVKSNGYSSYEALLVPSWLKSKGNSSQSSWFRSHIVKNNCYSSARWSKLGLLFRQALQLLGALVL